MGVVVRWENGESEGEAASVFVRGRDTRPLANCTSVGCGDGMGVLNIGEGAEVKVSRGLNLGRASIEDNCNRIVYGAGSRAFAPKFKNCEEGVEGQILAIEGGTYSEVAYEAFAAEMNAAMNFDRNLTENLDKLLLAE